MFLQVEPVAPIGPYIITTNCEREEMVYLPAYRDEAYWKAIAQMDAESQSGGWFDRPSCGRTSSPAVRWTNPRLWRQLHGRWMRARAKRRHAL